ncbi:PepSY domain-containing protein [Amphritea sp. 1_MG-2023]|uniref:PepSY domain-containing protein n=1 Tax=Amphritea sp. 1_MG-2023 TaxID=3062670 RepID=UPI0026E37CB5|nr:PepSY domain-containing protein [Amphritea sp. 1_MG-2023]MDO6561855.1 PepSY domain-containing protein [Amphritea sp. 1_MG-2023]
MINLAVAGSDVSDTQVREWVAAGKMMSFADIYSLNQSRLAGRLLDLEVEEEDHRLIYEIEVLGADGEVREFHIDAENGRVLKEERDD